jgi:hypothetical protein
MSTLLSPPETSPTVFPILVTGDVVVDHHIYEGERTTAAAYNRRGFKVVREHGGAAGLCALLQALIEAAKAEPRAAAQEKVKKAREQVRDAEQKQPSNGSVERAKESLAAAEKQLAGIMPAAEENCTVEFALNLPELHSQPSGHHAFATWKPFPENPADAQGKKKVWRASLLMGYGDDEHTSTDSGKGQSLVYSPKPEAAGAQVGLLILDDAGFVFRHKALTDCWLLPNTSDPQPEWLLLKMSGPVCQGDLWPTLSSDFGDRLICVVSAADLRKESVSLSTGLSWELTVEDLHHALHDSPVLKSLTTVPRHLIVTFSADGALWLDNTDRNHPQATLVFDASGAEGEWAHKFEGEAFGYLSCLVAAITRAVIHNPAAPSFAPAVAAGLAAMRNLRALGHGPVGKDFPAGFPNTRLAKAILKGGGDFSFSRVPWTDNERKPYDSSGSPPRTWRIVEMSQSPFPGDTMPSLLGLARQVVLQGRSAIRRLPHASFGELLTADRSEIEALRTIRRSMLSYWGMRKVKRPLSIGVFGPPGAGKSFGVQQIANDVFTDKAWLPFNLSQFKDSADLIGAFHQVRDKVLSGVTPVVFWDEFDSKEYDWLQYLLAPMQDGRFQNGQLNHAIGKCVFIFAGGTSHTFEGFGPAKSEEEAFRTYRLCKGPDFHSRLDAFYDVLGPNQRMLPSKGSPPSDHWVEDARDVCAPLRRALLIRALLKVPEDARLDFDAELLDALLRVRGYKHGARSLEKLVISLQPASAGEPIRRSALPPITQIAMHVVEENEHPDLAFDALLDSNIGFLMSQAIPPIAKAIHEEWLSYASKTNPLNRPWDELTAAEQEDNRAAARRIPEVLALAGLAVEKGVQARGADTDSPPGGPDIVELQIEHHIERLAEAEHDGWMDQRIKNGWTYDPKRDDLRKKHPLLIPYAELPEQEKNKDRGSVRDYRKHLASAGYKIVFVSATLPELGAPRA